jgi:hypothetical protein
MSKEKKVSEEKMVSAEEKIF